MMRAARIEEANVIAGLIGRAFLDYVRGLGRDWPGPYEDMPDRIAAGQVLVLDGDDGPVAALVHSRDSDVFNIDMIAIDPDHQGQGLSKVLLAQSEELARAANATEIRLHTVAKYDRLVRLYESSGFQLTHTGPRPKGDDGHPRAFMAKKIFQRQDVG